MLKASNPVLRLKTRSQTCVGGICHISQFAQLDPRHKKMNEVLVHNLGNNSAIIKSKMTAIGHDENIRFFVFRLNHTCNASNVTNSGM